jgi:predicted ATPase
LPANDATRRLELRLQTQLMGPLIAATGYASPDAAATYARARALAQDSDDPNLIFPVLYGQCVYWGVKGDVPGMLEAANQFATIADAQGGPGPALVGHRLQANVFFLLGKTSEASSRFAHSLLLFDAERNEALTYQYGQDQQVAALTFGSIPQWQLGYRAGCKHSTYCAMTKQLDATPANSPSSPRSGA